MYGNIYIWKSNVDLLISMNTSEQRTPSNKDRSLSLSTLSFSNSVTEHLSTKRSSDSCHC